MLILASKSPRRYELLKLITTDFKVSESNADENINGRFLPEELTMYLSKLKAENVIEDNLSSDDIIIGADTVVAINNEILGKPKNYDDAYMTLKKLSGNKHSVYTGVTIIKGSFKDTFFVKTDVYFYDLSDEQIVKYLENDEYKDKAGSYGIQGLGGLFVRKIDGDYNNVVGLPVAELSLRLSKII